MKFYLTFIFLCVGFLINCSYAQSQKVNIPADKALEAVLVERDAYFSRNEETRQELFFKRAQIFQETGNYSLAVEELKRIPQYNLNDSLNEIWIYRLAFNLYLCEEFGEADSYLSQLFINNDTVMLNKYAWLKILCLNEMGKWNEAKSLIEQTPALNHNKSLLGLYASKNFPKLKSPHKAQVLNLFLPGLGFLYTGYILEGVVSSGLILASLALTAGAVYYGYYVSAVLGGVQLSQMFYLGGVRRVEFLANKHNYSVSKTYNEKLKKLILDN